MKRQVHKIKPQSISELKDDIFRIIDEIGLSNFKAIGRIIENHIFLL